MTVEVRDLYGPEFFVGRTDTVRLSASAIVPLIAKYVRPWSMLDIGCGQGEWVQMFEELDVEAFGVDIAAPDHLTRRGVAMNRDKQGR